MNPLIIGAFVFYSAILAALIVVVGILLRSWSMERTQWQIERRDLMNRIQVMSPMDYNVMSQAAVEQVASEGEDEPQADEVEAADAMFP